MLTAMPTSTPSASHGNSGGAADTERTGWRPHHQLSLLNQTPFMKLARHLALATLLVSTAVALEKPASHTQGTATGKPTGALKPGEYWWRPEISPKGPVVALVSIPL